MSDPAESRCRPDRPMLTLAQVPGYLLGRGLISAATIVDGDLIVQDLSSRNSNFSVACGARGYLLKQAARPQGAATLVREAAVYRTLAPEPTLRDHLPACLGYDTDERVLILELVRDAVDLDGFHRRRRLPSSRVAATLGAVLGALHEVPEPRWSQLDERRTDERWAGGVRRPAAFSLHRPGLELYRTASRAGRELIRVIQGARDLGDELDELADEWSPSCLIHGDLRGSNVLLRATPAGVAGRTAGAADGRTAGVIRAVPRVKLVDWELAGAGDPRWDIGFALANYLMMWLSSVPLTAPPARFLGLARSPLSLVQPAIRACWDGYRIRRGLNPDRADRLLRDTVRFVAARLVQIAFEAAQATPELTGESIRYLQVAQNMLARPQEAAVHLLGLGPAGRAPTPADAAAGGVRR